MTSTDRIVAQTLADAINLALSTTITFKRLPLIRTETVTSRTLYLTPYSDESSRIARDEWDFKAQLALTHVAPLPGVEEFTEDKIEAELEFQEEIRRWLILYSHETHVHVTDINRLTPYDFDMAAKKKVFHSQLLLQTEWIGDWPEE